MPHALVVDDERDSAETMAALIATQGFTVATAGSVRFLRAPENRGTEVRVALSYNPPGGQAGHALAWLAGRDPASQVRYDLRNFKRTMETGVVPASAG